MSIADKDLLAYGAHLATGTNEIEWRTSVGRSYYAAFHRAVVWEKKLPERGESREGQGVHAKLIESLCKPSPLIKDEELKKRSRSIGYMLDLMKKFRTKADYKLDESLDQQEAETASAYGVKVLEKA